MGWQEDVFNGGRMPSHRERYPEQYTHELVGRWVHVLNLRGEIVERGEVERVAPTRFGNLAHLKGGGDTWYSVERCVEADPEAAA